MSAALTSWRTAACRGPHEFDHESQRKDPKMGLEPQDLEAIRALVREELEAEHEQSTAAALAHMAAGYRDGEAARAAEDD